MGKRDEAFTTGLYIKQGYIITSWGCHNHCWQNENSFSFVVFDMLKHQKYRPDFTDNIEPKFLRAWHIELFQQIKPKYIFFAYNTPDDMPPIEHAAKLFKQSGYGNRNILRCYVLRRQSRLYRDFKC